MPPKKKMKATERRFAEDFLKKWKNIEPKSDHSRFERILKEQENELEKDPANIDVLMERGKILVEMQLYSDALECFDSVVNIKPRFKEAWNARGNALSLLGHYDEAAESYKKAVELVSTRIEKKYKKVLSEEKTIEDLLEELVTDEFEERYLKELGRFEKRLSENKSDVDAWYGKAQILKDMGRSREALNALHEVTKLDTNYPNVWKLKGDLFKKIGDETKASICYKRAIEFMEEAQVCPLCDNMVPAGLDACATCGAELGEKPKKKVKKAGPKAEEDKGERLKPAPSPIPESKEEPKPKKPSKGPPPKDMKEFVSRLQPERKFKRQEGKVNGLVNGLGRINGIKPGKVNGLVNGVGRVNGLVNGVGRVNGLVNGVGRVNGLVNGMGRVNGLISQVRTGRVNGLVNGFSSTRRGLSNGITNGSGLTNGLGSRRFGRETARNKWKLFVIPLIAMVLIVMPYMSVVKEVSHPKISIDGEFSDWTGRTTGVGERPLLNPSVDIINIGIENNGEFLSFFIETKGAILKGGNGIVDTFMVFIDYDLNHDTGYRIDHLGADYMAMIYGIDFIEKGSRMHQFDNMKNHDDWNGWSLYGKLAAASSGNRLEAQVSWDILGDGEKQVDALFYSQDYDRGEDFSGHIVSNVDGVLSVETKSAETVVFSGNYNPVLEIGLEAIETDIELTDINIRIVGTADVSEIVSLTLVDQVSGNPLKQVAPSSRDVSFAFDSPVNIEKGDKKEWLLRADVLGSSGNTLGATIKNPREINIEEGTVSLYELPSDAGLGYIGFIPLNFTIDGGFSDWTTPESDFDASPLSNPDIDIRDYDFALNNDSFYFYLKVEGALMNGTSVPYRNQITGERAPPGPIDSDMDTVPDEFDPLPFNFDNQGLDDLQTDNDVDEDGVKDYPYGNDYWLNTTILNDTGIPPEYWGKEVNLFIGPVEKPSILGEDVIRIYMETANNSGNGYLLKGLSSGDMYADYLIEIKGKNGNILSNDLLSFNGQNPGTWDWEFLMNIDELEKDGSRIEGSLDIALSGISSLSFAFIQTSDWDQNEDDIDDRETVKSVDIETTKATALTELVSGVGTDAGDKFGWNVSYAGDVNNDGYPDVIVGAPYNDTSDGSMEDAGAAYIFFGYSTISASDINAANANVSIYGATAGDHLGWSVSDLSNVDSDTKDDIIIGAPDAGGTGKAYIFYGRASWSTSYVATSASVTISGENSGDKFGCSVSGAGDFDNSNYNDIVIGAYGYSSNTGRAYLFLGDGSIPTSAGSADKINTGETSGDMFGFSVSNAGDVDNDGKDDVIIGAPYNDDSGTSAGEAYIYFGGDQYVYVDSNTVTKGYMTDFNNAKSASDGGAYATLKEGDDGPSLGSEYLYVDGFDWTRDDWIEVGSSPYLDAVDDTNRIYTSTGNDKQGEFSFDDTTIPGTFTSSYIELYSKQDGAGEYIEVNLDDGTGLTQIGTITPNVGSYTWQSIDVSSYLDTRAKVDGATMRVVYEKDGPGGIVDLDCARINFYATAANLYKMDIEFNTTNVLPGSNYYLELNYNVDGTETDFGVLVYDGSSWDDMSAQGDLDQTSLTAKSYTLDSDQRLGSGYVRVRFIGRNETSDIVNSTLNIEYHRIRIAGGYLTLSGESAGDMFGWSVGNTSDINEDGSYDDVVVGAPGYSSSKGRAYIFHGASSMDSTADLTLTGETNGDQFGFSVHAAGDIDEDGVPDVVVGAPYHDNGATTDAGIIYVFKGGSSMDSTYDYYFNGTQASTEEPSMGSSSVLQITTTVLILMLATLRS
jgi:tetratricopeptide (TPR) repeat protein